MSSQSLELGEINTQAGRSQHVSVVLTGCLLLALLGYYLPWLSNAAAGLSANAFDLAEWLSLSPLARISNPPLLAPFLLRVGLGLLAVLFALNARRAIGWGRWLTAALSLLLTATLFPPIEFIRAAGGMDDPNYRQLFGLLLITLISVLAVALAPGFQRWWQVISSLLEVLLIVSSVWGTALAFTILAGNPLRLTTPLGIGVILMILAIIGHQIVLWRVSKP